MFQRLALTRLNEAAELYQRARKGRSRIAWHRLRIGLKGFRYTLENFMPQRYQPWSEDLKRIQDLLGEVHDMDVLRSRDPAAAREIAGSRRAAVVSANRRGAQDAAGEIPVSHREQGISLDGVARGVSGHPHGAIVRGGCAAAAASVG